MSIFRRRQANDRPVFIFLSYSRSQANIQQQIRRELTAPNIAVSGDWNLHAGPEYPSQLEDLIKRSDVFVFLLTPDSCRSPFCLWELAVAVHAGKRVQPLDIDRRPGRLISDVVFPDWVTDRSDVKNVSLRELNGALDLPQAINGSRDDMINQLKQAVLTDLRLTKRHTDVLIAAERWHAGGRRRSALLRGRELRAAEEWLAEVESRGSDKLPQATELQCTYIAASRQWVRVWWVGVGALAATVGIVLVLLLNDSDQKGKEVQRRAVEEESRATAARAMKLLRESIPNARTTAESALQAATTEAATDAFRQAVLAVESFRLEELGETPRYALLGPDRIVAAIDIFSNHPAKETVAVWARCPRGYLSSKLASAEGQFTGLAISPATGRIVASGPKAEVRLFDGAYAALLRCGQASPGRPELLHAFEVPKASPATPASIGQRGVVLATTVAISEDGTRVAAAFSDGRVVVWSSDGSQVLLDRFAKASIISLGFDANGGRLLATAKAPTGDGMAYVWSLADKGNAACSIDTPGVTYKAVALTAGLDGHDLLAIGHDSDRNYTRPQRGISSYLGPPESILTQCPHRDPMAPYIERLSLHEKDVTAVAFAGAFLYTASADQTVKVWDVGDFARENKRNDGRIVFTLKGEQSDIISMSWLTDGMTMATFTSDGWFLVRRIDTTLFKASAAELRNVLEKRQKNPNY